MANYLAKRIFKGLLTIFVSVTITFFIIRLMPSDPVTLLVDPKMSPEVQQAMMRQFGLDKPIGEQYLVFIQQMMTGNLGISFKTREPVTEVIMQKLPWTLLLLFLVVVLSLAIGIPIGMLAAKKRNSVFDKIINVLITTGISIFIPFLSFALLYIFAYYLKLFPTGGAYTPPPQKGFAYIADVARHAVLPALTLFINNVAAIILYTRNSMIDVLKEDYIRTAYAKGWHEKYVIKTHALKNALIPTITVTGLMVGSMVGGAVMTETVYAWPGIGRLIYDSVSSMDFPVLQGAFLILAISVVVMSIVTDLIVAWLDPRIKLGG
ncbi:dipeptide transport system permease protein DppB [Oxobacter pfennigii]|uniref:Dipeptide transport system permease protein DppB n=1 Tax=Oxobacter pfennigii TaxID=36849 RepID=A0A0P8YRV5_9CLOT|nr:ABC transporter permease [Oxobacter pfennigii]KPU42341.1 dipeptide transport system permease protein DppB [Oxobacter pfennigii]